MENAVKKAGEFTVTRTRIIGTRTFVYSAYEPYNSHHTFTHIDGVRVGRVASREISRKMDQLPAYSEERSTAVRAFLAANRHVAYVAILAAFPEAQDAGLRDNGDIEIQEAL